MGSILLHYSKQLTEFAAHSVEFAAALIISVASIEATIRAAVLFVKRDATPDQKNSVRLTLARWLALALEFELAADILNTAISPSWREIEILTAIAALRTALNYFLERELEQEAKPAQRYAEAETTGPATSVLQKK